MIFFKGSIFLQKINLIFFFPKVYVLGFESYLRKHHLLKRNEIFVILHPKGLKFCLETTKDKER